MPHRVIISGGGTGGHIFPAIAIANALKRMKADTEILFVGARDRMEMEKVPNAGYEIEGLWISGLQRKLTLKNLSFPFKLISSWIKSKQIIKRFNPDVVIGVGGYSSGPVLQAATGKGIPALIQEQNSYAGITNKLLSKKVQKICVAYEGMEKFFPKEKIKLTGNPVRKVITDTPPSKTEALNFFELDQKKLVVLAVGGSLGSRTINESLIKSLEQLEDNNIQLLLQTGKITYQEVADKVKKFPNVKAVEFINRMDMAYAAADIIISRAGAIAVSELCIIGKPVILIPYPYAAEDHQAKNGQALVEKEAAIMIRDEASRNELIPQLLKLVEDKTLQRKLGQNIKKMAITDAADQIAKEIFTLIEKKKAS